MVPVIERLSVHLLDEKSSTLSKQPVPAALAVVVREQSVDRFVELSLTALTVTERLMESGQIGQRLRLTAACVERTIQRERELKTCFGFLVIATAQQRLSAGTRKTQKRN